MDKAIEYETSSRDVYRHDYCLWVELGPNEFRKGNNIYERVYYQYPKTILFTSYNPFPVDVIYEYELADGTIRTEKIVIPPAKENEYSTKKNPYFSKVHLVMK